MEIAQLEQFEMVAELGSINQASAVLFVSQPSLSKSMHRLEDELGVELFHRNTKSKELTKNGKRFLGYTKLILENARSLETGAQIVSKSEIINICTDILAVQEFMTPKFMIEYPNLILNVRLESSEYYSYYLLHDSFDLLISSVHFPDDELISSEKLYANRTYLAVPVDSPLAVKELLRLADLQGLTIINIPSKNQGTTSFYKKIEDNGIHVNRYLAINNISLYNLAKSKDFFILSSTSRYSYEVERMKAIGRVLIPFDKSEVPIKQIYISYLKRNAKKLASIINWFQKETGNFL